MSELILDGGEKLDGTTYKLRFNDTPDGTCVTISSAAHGGDIVAVIDKAGQRKLVKFLAERLWTLEDHR